MTRTQTAGVAVVALALVLVVALPACVVTPGRHRHHPPRVFAPPPPPSLAHLPAPPVVFAPPPAVVIPMAPPPPPRVVRPPSPGPGHVLVPGRYVWQGGRHVWVPPVWNRPPRPGAAWMPPHRQRVPGGVRVVPGHWRGRR
ncbi:YXWGXW repeat-containing protein [bacterium]|nr:YXWGXW repeat-containing protein [bacterium]